MIILNKLLNGKRKKYTVMILLILFSTVFYYSVTQAYRTGVSGKTNNGCTCHGSQNANTILNSSIQSGIWTVMAGSTNTMTVTVANSGKAHAGVNIAVKTASDGNTNAGSLSPVSGYGLQTDNGELIHTNPKPYSSSAEYQFTWTAPDTPGTYYLKAAGNAVDSNNSTSNDQWNFMSVRSITVQAAPSVKVTSPNGGEGLCPGSSKNITWTYETVTNVKIELSTNGGSSFDNILTASTPASAGSWSWSIPGNQQVGNNYKIKISDASNSSVFDISDNNFSISSQTSITEQPQSISACTGQQAQLSITAAGSNLNYQWRKNGQNIPNSNTATYTINPVTTQAAGSYDCIVTGSCGNPVTSTSATLTVDISPTITTQPISKTACTGQNVTFSVSAEGTDLKYQWKKNGQNIADQTASSITLNNVTESDAGTYYVVVSGKCNPAVTSQNAILKVPSMPLITLEPKSQTACEGSRILLFATVTGDNLTYSWWKNNSEISNSNNDTLIIDNASQADAGTYFIKILTDCDLTASSSQVTVTINPKPQITKDPSAIVVNKGQKAEFSITAVGDNLQYQWMKDGKNIENAKLSKYTINAASITDNGLYSCKVSNSCGEINSKQAQLTVQETASAILNFTENPLFFGKLENGKTLTKNFENAFENMGELALNISSISLTGADASDFELVDLNLPLILNQNDKSGLSIKFSPKTAGEKKAVINFTSNSAGSGELAISAFSVDLKLDFSITELIFNFKDIGSVIEEKFTVINNSNTELDGKLSVSGKDSERFSIKSLQNFKINSKSTYEGSIAFEAVTSANAEAELNIDFPEFAYKTTIPLKGNNVNSINDSDLEITLEVTPNPAANGIYINLSNISGNDIEIKIFNPNGILVRNLFEKNFSEKARISWDLMDEAGNSVPNGLYNALIIIEDKLIKKPILIVK